MLTSKFWPFSSRSQGESNNYINMRQLVKYLQCHIQTAPSFTFDQSLSKFEGPAQKTAKEQDIAKATEEEDRKQVTLWLHACTCPRHACTCMQEKSCMCVGPANDDTSMCWASWSCGGGKWCALSGVWGRRV